MAQGEAGAPQTVFAKASDEAAERVRIRATTPEALIDAVAAEVATGTAADGLLVELDAAAASDMDTVIALGAVLVEKGVTAIETTHVRSVRRLFDTRAAIAGGTIEAISR